MTYYNTPMGNAMKNIFLKNIIHNEIKLIFNILTLNQYCRLDFEKFSLLQSVITP